MATLKKFPDTLLLLMGFLLLFTLLTWLIPAGQFERQELNGREVVVPGSYQRVESTPQGVGDFLMAPFKGFIAAADILAFLFFVGGAFSILKATGAISAGLESIVKASKAGRFPRKAVIPLVMVLFSLCGATFGMSEEVLVFVLITIPLALALGYDVITGVAISFVGAGAGFAGAFLNPFTVGVAQGIAELPPFSGIEYRLFAWTLTTTVAILYVMRYARRVAKQPESSLMAGQEQLSVISHIDSSAFTARHRWLLLLLVVVLGLLVLGAVQWGWYIAEITGLFVAFGIVAGWVGQLGVSKSLEAFKEGAIDMLTPALVIALAKGLIVLAQDGHIIDTVLHGIAQAAAGLPAAVSVEIMFVLQTALNFFVPSGSGQAALTMPIMAPLGDLLGLSRQVVVLAFQFGDGFSNLIIPTSGVTMGVIGIAKIPYPVWFRWILPLFGWLSLLAGILLLLPVLVFAW